VLPRVVISLDILGRWDLGRWGYCCILQPFGAPDVLLAHDVTADRFQEASCLVSSAYLNSELFGKAIMCPHAPGPPLHTLPAPGKGQHILFSSVP